MNDIFLLRHRRAHSYGERVKVEEDRKVNIVVELIPPRNEPDLLARLDAGEVVDAEEVDEE